MVKKTVKLPYNCQTYLNSIYRGDIVIYKLEIDKEAIGDCTEMIFNIYDAKGGIRVFNKPIIDNVVYLPLDHTEIVGEYEIVLWARNKADNTQIHYGMIKINVRELIGTI